MQHLQLKKYFISFLLTVGLASCATSAGYMADLKIRMTRSQVINILGTPNETKGKENTEVLRYLLATDRNVSRCIFLTILTLGIAAEAACQSDKSPYFVRLVDGRVAEFGDGWFYDKNGNLPESETEDDDLTAPITNDQEQETTGE